MKVAADKIKKIGILRALQLGDMLCAIPAVRALRNSYPQAEIVLLGLPWASSFVSRFNNYFNRFIHFPGYEGLPEQHFDKRRYDLFMDQIKAEAFDLLLQMQGNGTIVNEMIKNWGARHVAGFRPKDSDNQASCFVIYPENIHEIKRHLILMEHLGVKPAGTNLEFPVTDADRKALDLLRLPFARGEYVCVHPGSRGSYRQWPPELFAAAANICYQRGYNIVITGVNGEQDIVEEVIQHLNAPFFNACGKTGLGSAALLIENSGAIICNCTGVSHIAAAVGTPGIVISMDGEPERWAPLNEKLHKTINWLDKPDLQTVWNELEALLRYSACNPGLQSIRTS